MHYRKAVGKLVRIQPHDQFNSTYMSVTDMVIGDIGSVAQRIMRLPVQEKNEGSSPFRVAKHRFWIRGRKTPPEPTNSVADGRKVWAYNPTDKDKAW